MHMIYVSTLCGQNCTSSDLENLSTNAYRLHYLSAHGYIYLYFNAWRMINMKKEDLDEKKEASSLDLAHAALQLHICSSYA